MNHNKMVKLLFSRGIHSSQVGATSLYEVLGVKQDASKEEIKTAFYGLSKQDKVSLESSDTLFVPIKSFYSSSHQLQKTGKKAYHPDMVKKGSPSHLKYVQIVEAYNVLSRAESRQKYDKTAPQRSSITFSRSDMETRQPATMHGQYSYYYAWNNGGGFHKNPFINECTIPLTEDDLRRRRWIITLFFLISLVATLVQTYSHTLYRIQSLKATEENWKAISNAEKYSRTLTLDENVRRVFAQDHCNSEHGM
ncbi:hypothetical protein M513_10589 [Trichuris suis]|uniref:J domain-containing protein n=1 Tax=Trichuris suis TaxID=68888 RepID=A0A085LU66_9BILA|nr:hypothetical protein M513_10589 [Trichuris suis]